VAAHDSAAAELVDGLHRLGTEELRQGDAKDQEQAADQVRTAVVLGTLLLVLAGVVLAVAVIMVNRLVRRLARLRDDTLRRAEHDLPAAVGAGAGPGAVTSSRPRSFTTGRTRSTRSPRRSTGPSTPHCRPQRGRRRRGPASLPCSSTSPTAARASSTGS
jgi:HAMP domain-containing protein